MIDNMGGRKTVALVILMLLGLSFALWKGDIPANFLNLLQFAFGAFIAGNAVEHGAEAYKSVNVVDTQEMAPAISTLLETSQATQVGVATIQQTLTAIVKAYNIKG